MAISIKRTLGIKKKKNANPFFEVCVNKMRV